MPSLLPAVALLTCGLCFLFLISPRMQRSRSWGATVTPLASIIGSGFLVSVPLLSTALSLWAIPAVLGLCLLAYLIGGVIRSNIARVEPVLAQPDHPGHKSWVAVETLSHLVLSGAYFVSVAYYLSLLATFALRLAGIEDPLPGRLLATALVAGVAGLGALKGLSGVERAEKFTVAANLSAITGLLVALVLFGLALPEGYSWTSALGKAPEVSGETLRFLLGLLIIVQGFETSRYMGKLYDAQTRIKAMRRAQLLSTAVYGVFFLLMVPLYPFFTGDADVAGVIEVVGRVSPVLPFIVAAGAIASQFSASVADSIGAGGLISDLTGGRVPPRLAYVLIGAAGCLIIWETDVVQVVALASRAFAAYYALQCLLGVMVALHEGARARAAGAGALLLLCLAVVAFGLPSGG